MKTTRLAAWLVTTALLAGSLGAQTPDSRAARMDKERDNAELQKVPAFKVFDNLHYVGVGWVGSWLVSTGQGLILIDTLEERYASHVLEGVTRLGFNLPTSTTCSSCRGTRTILAASPISRKSTALGWRWPRATGRWSNSPRPAAVAHDSVHPGVTSSCAMATRSRSTRQP